MLSDNEIEKLALQLADTEEQRCQIAALTVGCFRNQVLAASP